VAESVEELISQGNEAYRRGDAAASRRAFEAALESEETGGALEGMARALYLELDYPGSLEAHERAYSAYRREGNLLSAARAGRMLAWLHGNLYGDWALVNGWLGRVQSFLAEAGQDSVEHGWIQALSAWTSSPDDERREERFRRALAIGRRFGDRDLEFEALAWLGLELVMTGRVEEGMLHLDEALAAVCAGEVEDLYVTEAIFCGMFMVCERLHDVARAEQWMRAADDMVRRRNLVAIGGFCRAHYGGILTAAGRWREAEVALTEAAEVFRGGHAAKHSDVMVRLADLRVRQGRLEEAEQLLEGLDQHPDAARPLAALRLARGEVAVASDLLERALAQEDLDPVVAGPLLALQVDVHLAAGAVEAGAAAAQRLVRLSEGQPGPYLRACAALAKGKVCVAASSGDARACLVEALSAFSQAQMPVELARARLELARAVASERPEVALAEARSALEAFERLEAARDADAAAALLRTLGGPARTGPKVRATLTKRELEVLGLLGHGLSNPEIGDRLYISAKTVEHHVGRILSKLGLRNRAEAAAYATRAAGAVEKQSPWR
jgi:DNA-binding NarL/FixJ family response regulator